MEATARPVGDSGRVWALSRLAEPEVVRLVTEVTRDQRLPTEMVREIVRRTDGVPLFVEELTKMLVESAPAQRQPTTESIPVTLQDSLLARLDRLGPAKLLAQWGALLGREFRQDLLEAVAGLEPGAATPELERLTGSGLLARTGPGTPASFMFKHALVQDAASHSLLKATRRAWHRRIGETLERRFPELAATQPERPAWHYTEGRDPRAALVWWYRAGEAALARAAHPEAEAHFRTGLGLLRGLSNAADLTALELQYCLALGNLLMATQGYAAPEVGRLFGRARELCQELRAQPQLAPAISGLWSYSIVRCEYAESTALAAQMMALARETGAGELELEAEAYAGINLFWAEARFAEAGVHLERAAALYDVERDRAHAFVYGQDPGVIASAHLVWVLWILGETEAAVAQVAVLRRLARARGHAHSCSYALAWENTLWFLTRRAQAALRCSGEARRYCTEQGFPLWHSVAAYVNAWARTVSGQGAGALEQIQEALGAWRATGAVVSQAYQLSVLAEVHRLRGDPRAALQTLEEALALTRTCGERWYRPELLRLRAELLLARPAAPAGAAESNLREALDLARASGARMWELRAALSLARLWHDQGRAGRARRLLEPVCAGFPAGFAEPEFLEAQRLLGQAAPAAAN